MCLTQNHDSRSFLPLGRQCWGLRLQLLQEVNYLFIYFYPSRRWYEGNSVLLNFPVDAHKATLCCRTVEWKGSCVSREMASVWLMSTESFQGWFMSHLKYAFNLDLWPVGEAAAFYGLKCLVHVKTCLVSLFILNQGNVHDHTWNSFSSVHLVTSPLATTST